MTSGSTEHGNFTRLADSYSEFRSGYSDSILDCILGLFHGKAIDAVDVGAGTGIWTRMMARRGLSSVVAVEPNDAMRLNGLRDSTGLSIAWKAGSGEETGLADSCSDLVTMASSFHWVDFDKGVAEFSRILRPGGWFVALWNPRLIEVSPLLVEIENQLMVLCPTLQRRSSGRSGRTDGLTDRLAGCRHFDDVIYLEGRHVVRQSIDAYIGAWRSVNDVQVQLGPEKFESFLQFIRAKMSGMEFIDSTYMTRAWGARCRK